MKRIFILIVLATLMLSCHEKKGKDIKVEYFYIKNGGHPPVSMSDRRDGTVVLTFTSYFDKDTVQVNYADNDTTIYLTTSDHTGLAELCTFGKIRKGESLKLRFNNYNPVEIKTDENNQIFLVAFSDSILRIRSVYVLPGFR
jgi:hypothetical protein